MLTEVTRQPDSRGEGTRSGFGALGDRTPDAADAGTCPRQACVAHRGVMQHAKNKRTRFRGVSAKAWNSLRRVDGALEEPRKLQRLLHAQHSGRLQYQHKTTPKAGWNRLVEGVSHLRVCARWQSAWRRVHQPVCWAPSCF